MTTTLKHLTQKVPRSFWQTLCFDAAADVEAFPEALGFDFAFSPHHSPALRKHCKLHSGGCGSCP